MQEILITAVYSYYLYLSIYVTIGPISLTLHQIHRGMGKSNGVSISPLFRMSLNVALSKEKSQPIVISMHVKG